MGKQCLGIGRLDIVKMSVLPQTDTYIQYIANQNPRRNFCRIDKLILKLIFKAKKQEYVKKKKTNVYDSTQM